MFTRGFSGHGPPRLMLGVGVPVTYVMKVGFHAHDPTFIGFDSIPTCDGRTDTLPPWPISRCSTAKRETI